jgi:hypothetical protein
MSLPREPFDWTGPEDEPISLDATPLESVRSEGAESVLVEAEDVVRGAQEAIARQDTDPSVTLPSPSTLLRVESRSGLIGGSISRRSLAFLLTASCGLAFAHGWTTGASARPDPHSQSCDASHCQPNKSSNEWKEEQYP